MVRRLLPLVYFCDILRMYPGQLAYQSSVPKMSLRKTPELAEFQKFLVAQTARGTVTRQEVVSMIPPLFLDVQPQHRVLDMCAAPGSKTRCLPPPPPPPLSFLKSRNV